MPAQEESEDSDQYDSDESDESVGGASFASEPLVTRRPAEKTVAKESTATKAGQVRLFARSPLRRASPARDCAVEPATFIFGEPSVQCDVCRRRRRSLQEQLSRR
jgi:hypothetical protein